VNTEKWPTTGAKTIKRFDTIITCPDYSTMFCHLGSSSVYSVSLENLTASNGSHW